jgi:hypothetical protein
MICFQLEALFQKMKICIQLSHATCQVVFCFGCRSSYLARRGDPDASAAGTIIFVPIYCCSIIYREYRYIKIGVRHQWESTKAACSANKHMRSSTVRIGSRSRRLQMGFQDLWALWCKYFTLRGTSIPGFAHVFPLVLPHRFV